jgi:hypothetical protein
MSRYAHRLAAWQRWLLVGCGTLLLATGLAWLGVHYTIGAGADRLPPPAEAWLMRLHGLAGFAALFLLGAVVADHVPHGWRLGARHRFAGQRGSGLALCAFAALLALTGYALYYFAPEAVRPALGWAHAALGLAMAGLVLHHRRHSDTTSQRLQG